MLVKTSTIVPCSRASTPAVPTAITASSRAYSVTDAPRWPRQSHAGSSGERGSQAHSPRG